MTRSDSRKDEGASARPVDDCVLGVDIGSSGIRVAAYERESGQLRACVLRPMSPAQQPAPAAEAASSGSCDTVCQCCHELWAQGAVRPSQIVGIGVSSYCPSLTVAHGAQNTTAAVLSQRSNVLPGAWERAGRSDAASYLLKVTGNRIARSTTSLVGAKWFLDRG